MVVVGEREGRGRASTCASCQAALTGIIVALRSLAFTLRFSTLIAGYGQMNKPSKRLETMYGPLLLLFLLDGCWSSSDMSGSGREGSADMAKE